ncbi:MAG: hypothetical protein ACRD4B_08020 [Acidobacteriota bacterium]
MVQLIEVYFKLVKLMEDIDYYNKYPSRRYLKESISRENTIEGKVRAILQDSLIQREVFPDWISRSHSVNDTLEYYMKLNEKSA